MNSHFKPNHSKEVETVCARVQHSKKEIEQLKQELEKLINIGTQSHINLLPSAIKPEEVRLVQTTSPQPPAPKTQPKKNVPIITKKTEPPKTSPCKTRNYNVAEAREYIKKQREKRAEQLKHQIDNTQTKVEMKRQKLRELQQKSLELVNKNVQLKRERSKSREKEPLRIDHTNIKPQENKKQKTQNPPVGPKRTKSQDSLKVPQTVLSARSKSHERLEVSRKGEERESRSRTKSNSASSQKPQPKPKKLKKEHCVMTDNCVKDTKETQTSQEKKIESNWIMQPPVLPHPYNFINTVKRKLQDAIKIDIGVQNFASPEVTRSKDEIKELLIKSAKSDIKSFVSHGRPNLDLKLVENLELKPHISSEKIAKNLFANYDSESDTSKNIPEISSESLATVSSKPQLVVDKIKDLKLQTNTKSQNSYSSDFQTEETKKTIPSLIDFFNSKSDSIKTRTETEVKSLKEPSLSKSLTKGITIQEKSQSSISENLKTAGDSSSLKEPSVSLVIRKNDEESKNQFKNITFRKNSPDSVNKLHLKFEAEVRLLSDCNHSFKQFREAEEAYENWKSQNDFKKILQNVDTQTSFITKSSSFTNENTIPEIQINSINYSRGSENFDDFSKSAQTSLIDFNLSTINESTTNISIDDESKLSISEIDNNNLKNPESILSLNIFDQLIKDEDTRIQQLKAIIKIREQALLDRTKSELVWLEIQKKQLRETGKLEEASLLKKKQRGIIVKHEQERNEIKKLKQMQKEASEKRKNTLKQQRNLIKTQLSTDNMLSNISLKKRKEKRNMGPIKVVKSCSESFHSEASFRSSGIDDVLSVTSKSFRVTEESELDVSKIMKGGEMLVTIAERKFRMREAALKKRRKQAEGLLQWYQKLLDEERKIKELEAAANSVVKQFPDEKERRFSGKQLNQLWKKMTGFDVKKFNEEETYVMSQMALERLCKTARQYSNKNKKPKNSGINCDGDKITSKSNDLNYSFEFEAESVQDEKTKISSISELIDNFSKIEDEISTYGKKSEEIMSSLSPDRDLNEDEISTEIEVSSVLPEEKKSISDEAISQKPEEESQIEETRSQNLLESSSIDPISTQNEEIEDQGQKNSQLEESIVEELSSEKKLVSQIEESEDLSNQKIEDQKSTEKTQSIDEELRSEKESVSKIEESEDLSNQKIEEIEDPEKTQSIELSSQKESVSKIEESEDLSNQKIEEIEDPAKIELSSQKESVSRIEESEDLSNQKIEEIEDREKTQSIELSSQKESVSKIEESEAFSNQKIEEIVSKKSEEYTPPTSEEKSISSDLLDLEEAIESASRIEESLNQLNEKLTLDSISVEKTPRKSIDVKKRVSEILAEASLNRGDKSPRLQDLYITAYDVGTPTTESSEEGRQLPTDIFGSEAEELWRKQLAIEQEIKQIELQQKEQIPYVFMREIPNKPPPPYTPPSSISSLPSTILPGDVKELTEVASYSSKVLYKAYQNNNFDKVKFSDNGFRLFSKIEVPKICAEYVFNICKDLAKEHYKQFEVVKEPTWLALPKKPQLVRTKPPDAVGLEKLLAEKLKELFGFKKIHTTESAIIKWGRKKRDHVDEVLVIESQEEESEWTNFDKDELIVKNQVTDEIMKMLLDETAQVFAKIISKKKGA